MQTGGWKPGVFRARLPLWRYVGGRRFFRDALAEAKDFP
jgi:hypothetical protein